MKKIALLEIAVRCDEFQVVFCRRSGIMMILVGSVCEDCPFASEVVKDGSRDDGGTSQSCCS